MTTTQHTTQHDTTHTYLTLPVPTQELMRSVMGSGWDEVGNDWWRTAPNYRNGYDWNTIPSDPDAVYVTLAIADPYTYDTDEPAKVILRALSVNDIVQGVNATIAQGPWVRWDDLDANDGDAILQYAMLGKVVYG